MARVERMPCVILSGERYAFRLQLFALLMFMRSETPQTETKLLP